MDLKDVKRVMLSSEPVLWQDHWYLVTGCIMKLTGNNRQAKTEPFYYSLLLLDAKTKYHVFEVPINDVTLKRGDSVAELCS